MENIPKKIHLIYKTSTLPEKYAACYESILFNHPGWDIRIYSDPAARSVIQDCLPQILPFYDDYHLDVQRTDVFRLAAVYLFGGFYLDCDMFCLRPLDELLGHSLVMAEEKTLTDAECLRLNASYNLRIANYMFGGVARHAFLLDVLLAALGKARTTIVKETDVLESTGPGLLTDVYHEFGSRYDDITMLYNNDKKCVKQCGTVSCHFGDYAAHHHHGTWRWETN